jgi:hypothetical protein
MTYNKIYKILSFKKYKIMFTQNNLIIVTSSAK